MAGESATDAKYVQEYTKDLSLHYLLMMMVLITILIVNTDSAALGPILWQLIGMRLHH